MIATADDVIVLDTLGKLQAHGQLTGYGARPTR
jgi:hypothetical protein